MSEVIMLSGMNGSGKSEYMAAAKFEQHLTSQRSMQAHRKMLDVGDEGENTLATLAYYGKMSVRFVPDSKSASLREQAETWLEYILGHPVNFFVSENKVQFGNSSARRLGTSGVDYLVPIVVGGLVSTVTGKSFAVEHPETFLHPSAQAKVAEFLVRVAMHDNKVMITTHSDIVLNNLRIAFRNQMLDKLTILHFVEPSEAVSIEVDQDGGITNWPKGFFDQTDEDFRILFGL